MSDEQSNELPPELAERLRSIDQRLGNIESADQNMAETYSKSEELYRQKMLEYGKYKRGDTFRTIARVLMVLLLFYIAYRVSLYR